MTHLHLSELERRYDRNGDPRPRCHWSDCEEPHLDGRMFCQGHADALENSVYQAGVLSEADAPRFAPAGKDAETLPASSPMFRQYLLQNHFCSVRQFNAMPIEARTAIYKGWAEGMHIEAHDYAADPLTRAAAVILWALLIVLGLAIADGVVRWGMGR